MKQKQIDKILELFADKTQFALELAHRDAIIYGRGFISIDQDGKATYLDYEEAIAQAQFIKEHDALKHNR